MEIERKTNESLTIFFRRYEYELIVVSGQVLNDTVTPVIRKRVKEPPVLINPEDLGGNVAAGKIFTMGIRLRSEKVCSIVHRTMYSNSLNFLLREWN